MSQSAALQKPEAMWTFPEAAAGWAGATYIRVQPAIFLAAIALLGCSSPPKPAPSSADSSAVVAGTLLDTFVHGNPFYGSVVYLIEATPSSEEWWHDLARYRAPLFYPERNSRLHVLACTTCASHGRFHFVFSQVPAGDYFLYCRVFWANALGDSTHISGDAWVGTTSVAARETVRVTLRPSHLAFRNGTVRSRTIQWRPIADPDLPKVGDRVHVEELPEPLTRATPEYPADLFGSGVEGIVVVMALVGKDGLVKDARVTKSIPRLDAAALIAVRRWVFKPALSNNKPVAVWVPVPVRFTAEHGAPDPPRAP